MHLRVAADLAQRSKVSGRLFDRIDI